MANPDATFKVAVSKYSLSGKIPPCDPVWPRFNASFSNLDISEGQLIDKIYMGQPITTWHKDQWRSSENYLCGQYIGLDFDSGDACSSLAALAKDKFISRYASFLYTTMSHSPEAPRSRAIFLLDKPIMQAKNYTTAVTALLWIFGTADRQCKDAVRFFYGSKSCDVEYIGNVLPLTTVQEVIKKYQESGQAEKKRQAKTFTDTPPCQQEVADALAVIPAWGINYDEWLQVLMGIHSAFGEDGLELAERWADGAPNEVEQKWKSFRHSGVTVASIFGIAKNFGWKKTHAYIS